ncbi:MAG TPA: hypothetical protein PLU30_21960 [Verrucomicrobiae bacterium]|nr:hypothetical protein [Verrucomicrobiae bacterium]
MNQEIQSRFAFLLREFHPEVDHDRNTLATDALWMLGKLMVHDTLLDIGLDYQTVWHEIEIR